MIDTRDTRPHAESSISQNAAAKPTVGVVVLYYQFWPKVRETMDALLVQTLPPTEIVLVDNASEDGCLSEFNAIYPAVRVVKNAVNGGYAGGMNLGARYLGARCEHLLFLTHECVLAPDAIERMAEVLWAEPRAGCVGPLLGYSAAKGSVFSAGMDIVGPRHHTVHLALPARMDEWKERPPRSCDALDGACLLVKQRAFGQIDPFDEGYFLYFDETDFLIRMKRRGWDVACVPRALAWQQPGRRPHALWARNRMRFILRNFGVADLLLEAAIQAAKSLRLLLSANSESRAEGREVARGVFGFFCNVSARTLV